MDNRDTCDLKDNKKMDASKVWQWRIMRVKNYSRRPDPFYHCNGIGLDFNVTSNKQKKLDLKLVTNGVMLEICDFAKMVNKSKRPFIINILENNFNLGLENEQQRIDFTARVLHKIKELIRKPPKDKNDIFPLFDNDGVNIASTELTESFLMELDDTDESEHEDEISCSQATFKEHTKTESLPEHNMDGTHVDDGDHDTEFNCSGWQSAEELKEDVLPILFPYCEKIGLSLDVGSKQSLDPSLLSKGVMLEVVHFTRILTASLRPIVLGVLEHNFELDLKSKRGKNRAWFKILQLLKKRNRLLATGSKIISDFKNEPFSFQTHPFQRTRDSASPSNVETPQYRFKEVTKRRQSDLKCKQEKRALLDTSERTSKRRRREKSNEMETNFLFHYADFCTSQAEEGVHCPTSPLGESNQDSNTDNECDMEMENYYNCPPGLPDLDSNNSNECDMEQDEMEVENCYNCPLGESDLNSDKLTDSGSSGNRSHFLKKCSDSTGESQSSNQGFCASFLTTTDISSSRPTVNSNVNLPFESQSEEKGLDGVEEQTQTPRNAPDQCNMEQEEMGTEINMWKLRANRVKQILSTTELGPFCWSKRFGIDFSVGFHSKQSMTIDSLTNSALLEVAKFSLAMNSSQQNFIMEILEYNFDLYFHSEHHRNIFTCEIMNRVRKLKNCEDAVKFSNEIFELPVPMRSTNMIDQSVGTAKEECDDVPMCPPHSLAEDKEHISQKSVDLYPFCKEIGLKLHVNNRRPNKKLDINKLTNGAMTEVTNFAEELCGTFEQICVDILKHNFDLGLESEEADLARNIFAWIPVIVDQHNLSNCANQEVYKSSRNGFHKIWKLDCQNPPHINAYSAGPSQAADVNPDVDISAHSACQNEDNLKLWQLRANHVHHILSVPHEEQCPLYSYHKCKKVGIDFNVGSGVKQNLDLKILTNGIMVELQTFATALLSAQKHFITDILEYNFHLHFKTELHRTAFTQGTKLNVKELRDPRTYRKHINSIFELPDVNRIPQENTCCPKCYQSRNHKLQDQNEFDPGHMRHPHLHTMSATVSSDANCSAQKHVNDPSSTFSAAEDKIMDSYPHCKKIGFHLCVDRDRPKDKLDTHVLTHGIMSEVIQFTKKLCGTKQKIINDVLEHNFNIDMQHRKTLELFPRVATHNADILTWFNEVFDIQQFPQKPPGYVSKVKQAAAVHRAKWMGGINRRRLIRHSKVKRDKLLSPSTSVVKSKANLQNKVKCFPIDTDGDMASKSGEKGELGSSLLDTAVCDMEPLEIRAENDYTCPLGESDLDSDKSTDSEDFGYQDNIQNQNGISWNSDIPGKSESSCQSACASFLTTTDVSYSLPTVNSNGNLPFASQFNERGLDGGEEQTQISRNAPNECDMEQEEMGTEINMWKLRANRVKQILSTTELGPFFWSAKFGIDLSVGFYSKQNMTTDFLTDSVLLEVAKFSLAMNSSQQNFIMEILEYNFDLYLHSEHHRNIFTCEIMNRVRKLKNCEDAVKFSNEVFELPVPMRSTNMIDQSVGTAKEECDDVPMCPPHSLAEDKEHISQKSVDLYPFCKEIGLKLHVNNRRPNKKLDINNLTNGAMTEVTNFAEELCGTFEQICVDILKHNFDLGLESEEADLARNILTQIPVLTLQQNLKRSSTLNSKIKNQAAGCMKRIEQHCQNDSTHTECQNELNLKLWQLRANHIQHILSAPHEEHCPLYSYSSCKKIGIDFNLGSGVKRNLDPKLLTNGVMVELNTFAFTLLSAHKDFIAEILEYNFHLDFKNELHRSAFARETMARFGKRGTAFKQHSSTKKKKQIELPDTRHLQERYSDKVTFCPKCYQVRDYKRHQDKSDPSHMNHPPPHTMSGTVSVDANCSAQTPAKDLSSTFSAIEEKIMDSYPLCKNIGLNLCVDRDRPKDKLDMRVLTGAVMNEVVSFARILRGNKSAILPAILEHNFNLRVQLSEVDIPNLWHKKTEVDRPTWFSEVFVVKTAPKRPQHGTKMSLAATMHGNERRETAKKRQQALQAKEERAKLLNHNSSIVTKSTAPQPKALANLYPICAKVGVDLEMKSESKARERLSLLLLTRAMVFEIHTFASLKNGHYLPHTLFDILDYNFDLSSQHHRRWEFSIATASKINSMVMSYRNTRCKPDKVFKLPFEFAPRPLPSFDFAPNDSQSFDFASRDSQQTQTPRNALDQCNMEQEEMGTEINMWKLRANRVKQILSTTELESFCWSKRFGIDFSVGFHSKQNMTTDSLTNSALLEVAKFSLAMNSSQQNFIMEILEYNFDLYLHSEHHRNIFTCEIMNRVRKLKNCEDAVKFSNEVFELPVPMRSTNMIDQSVGTAKEECDDVPMCPPHSLAEDKEHISQKSVDLYPFCKEIGLKLHVNNRRPNKKLDINKLTNGAMTEVTNFAEELCGTFEQICVDILKHNFDLGLESEEADLARNILARIPVATLQQNVKKSCGKIKNHPSTFTKKVQHDSTHTEYQNELNLKLWQLRANHIQHILSAPHEEHCPLYSYSSCKKIGIDFNLGSGVKRNLDPKLLTNGVMVELNTFAFTLLSAHKDFITEILEYNFHLDFKNELHRSAFARETMVRFGKRATAFKQHLFSKMKNQIELPDTRHLQEHYSDKVTFCPKCYQVRDHKRHQDKSDPSHMYHPPPHTMSGTVSVDARCSAQTPAKDPSSTFSAIEEKIMDSYPLCKNIGLNLCVDRDRPKDKLDMRVLTGAVMNEVVSFASILRGNKSAILPAILEHNFNLRVQLSEVDIPKLWYKTTEVDRLTWFSEVFVVKTASKRPQHGTKMSLAATMHGNERRETAKKRQQALQAKEERAKLLNHNSSIVTKSTAPQPKALANLYPICAKVGVDLEMKSESKARKKLSLLLLTRAMVFEIHKFASLKRGHYLPHTLFDILDYNFNLSSQHHRCWEFSIATASKINNMVKSYRNSRCNPDKVFYLPFEFAPNDSQSCDFAPKDSQRFDFASRDSQQTQTPTNAPDQCDMEQEEMGTEINMWKLRANRVKQILSTTELGPFRCSKKFGIDFSVGFHSKQNMTTDSLTNSVLLEVAKFSLAMNSSQQNFIMEILEYNFDLYLHSEHHRNIFTCEIMNRVRKLKNCEDAVKFSNEVFELPGPMQSTNMIDQSVGTVKECDDVPMCPPHSLAEDKEHISQKSVDLYPFCKEIGLKLHVNNRRPNKKLDINNLTNGAMTEVTNFAEELCGTFEQICVDILKHNFDLGLESEEADLARNILARIPVLTLQQTLKRSSTLNSKIKYQAAGCMKKVQQHCQNDSTHTEYQNELNLKLWQLRANHIQHILSAPHEEHCPLYFYSSCKKIGIDFNLGSGVKRNLDPKLLTNGVMVELNTFAFTLLSAHEDFITEILEYNFHLDFKNELHRSAFAHETMVRFGNWTTAFKQHPSTKKKNQIELPDTRHLQERYSDKVTFCPKCYQLRDHKRHQDKSDPSHMYHPPPHTMSGTVSVDANCSAQTPAKDPSSTFSAIEEKIMDSYPLCKNIGLNLCVDRDRPKDKLDMRVLTGAVMNEVVSFARVLRGNKLAILPAILEHNFNLHVQISEVDIPNLWHKTTEVDRPTWFSEVFVVKTASKRPQRGAKMSLAATMHGNERRETAKKRQQALQAKEERAKLLNHNSSIVTKSTAPQPKALANLYPICAKVGVDLEMKSESKAREKLSLLLLTRAMVFEIHKFASLKKGHYLPHTLFDILDYNFDLSSQHHRRWEFSIATASKINSMVKSYRITRCKPDKVFKLPFEFAPRPLPSCDFAPKDSQSCDFAPKDSQRFGDNRESVTSQALHLLPDKPLDPVDAAESEDDCMVIVDSETTLVKEEEEDVSVDSTASGSEVDIKQE